MPALFLPLPSPSPTANLPQTGIGGQPGCCNSLPTTLSKIGNHSSRSPSPELETPTSCLPTQKLMTRPPAWNGISRPADAAQSRRPAPLIPSRIQAGTAHRSSKSQALQAAIPHESTWASSCANPARARNHALPLAASTHPIPPPIPSSPIPPHPSTQSHYPIRSPNPQPYTQPRETSPLKSHAVPYPGIVQRFHLTPVPPVPPPRKTPRTFRSLADNYSQKAHNGTSHPKQAGAARASTA